MKQMILGTRLGRLAMSVRDACSMLGTAYSSPEKLGTLANDHIASLLVTRLCQGGKIFIDIGAHIGSIISDVMHYCPGAEIIGVEPIPEKVAHLRRKFPNVKFMECALGESAGEATFYVNTRRSGFSTLGRPRDSFASQYVETRVPIKKLDNLVASDAVDVIKVDVEG